MKNDSNKTIGGGGHATHSRCAEPTAAPALKPTALDRALCRPHFIGHAELEQCGDGRNFEVMHSFGFWASFTGLITVPAKFKTDLASIPKAFWNILPPFGKYTDPAIIHDYLYRTQLLPRATCDRVLLLAMKIKGVPFWQRMIIYWNVRWFGFVAWADDSRHIPQPCRGDHKGVQIL